MSLLLLRWPIVCSSSLSVGGGVENVEADRRAVRFG